MQTGFRPVNTRRNALRKKRIRLQKSKTLVSTLDIQVEELHDENPTNQRCPRRDRHRFKREIGILQTEIVSNQKFVQKIQERD